jgi:hypothetical protein
VSLCRTSSDASQDRRKGRIMWLTLPVKDVSRTCIVRPACRRTLTTTPPTVIEESTESRQEVTQSSDKGAVPPGKYKASPIDLFSDYYLCQFDLLMACR